MSESIVRRQRRESILLAAEKVFDAHGYAAATMEQVASAAGVAKGSVYNYFPSKQDLFNQVFQAAMAEMQAESEDILSDALPAAERLDAMLQHWFDRFAQSKRVGRLVLEYWAAAARQQRGELAKMFQSMYAAWRELLSGVISDGIRRGEFNPKYGAPVAASLIMGILDGVHVQSILDIGLDVNDELVAALKSAILTALAGDGPPPLRTTNTEEKADE